LITAARGSTPDGRRDGAPGVRDPGSNGPGISGPANSSTTRGKLHEELGVLVLALLFLVLPALVRSTPRGPVHLESAEILPARIHINRAPWYEWTLLPGIGEARARNIVEYRQEHGEFKRIDDLLQVPRMPPRWVETAREHLHVERGGE